MERTARVYLSPVVALMTLAIGVGFVRAAETVIYLFEPAAFVSREQTTEENIGVRSSENFKSFESHDATTVTQGRVLSCYDPRILPIWPELKRDTEFKDRLDQRTGVMNCSELIEIEKVDLNIDGSAEFLVRGKGQHLCSAVGNCGFWIFEETKARPRILLSASDYSDIAQPGDQVLRSRTRGYSDILLKGHFSAAETGYYTYKFDGQKYAESRCVYEVPKLRREGEGSWEIITCQEFDRRNDL